VFFKTSEQCNDLAKFFGFSASPGTNALEKVDKNDASSKLLRVDFSKSANTLVLARHIVSWLGASGPRLLWVTEAGIWPSSENRHLYYQLRRSYHEYRPLLEAPGHYFEDYEAQELTTFLDLTLRFGWGAFLLGPPPYMTISHDGWILVGSDAGFEAILGDLDGLGLAYTEVR